MRTTSILCLALALYAGSALAVDSPWSGTWKLDPARSHFTGDTFTVTQGPGNMLHYADGSTASYDFGVDGKEYKTWANRTTTWTPTGKNSWDTVTKVDGRTLVKAHQQLSADGKTLSSTYTGTRPDGTAFHDEEVFARASGGEGLIGTWRAIKVSEPDAPHEYVISSPAPGVLRFEVPDMKASAEGRTDGSDNPLTAPNMPPGMTISWEMPSPTKIKYVMKVNGKTDNLGEQTLAADGKSFSDVNWNPGKENEKTTGVYVKQ
jgi:hypothetical protein